MSQVTPEPCKTPLEGWVLQQDPDGYDGTAKALGSLQLELNAKVELLAPVHVAPIHREDPMLLEAVLDWSLTKDEDKGAPLAHVPSASLLIEHLQEEQSKTPLPELQ